MIPFFLETFQIFLLHCFTFIIIFLLSGSIRFGATVDNLALLSGTLKTYHKITCDGEWTGLRCPSETSISIQMAQYGSLPKGMEYVASCLKKRDPHVSNKPNASAINNSKIANDTEEDESGLNMTSKSSYLSTCQWPTAIQTVVGLCQRRRSCKFQSSKKTFGGDPCPGIDKYLQVAYKCRPSEFRSLVTCESDLMQLSCNKSARIAIYSASYGRKMYEHVPQCPQTLGIPEETCFSNYSTDKVMKLCHGKRRCAFTVDTSLFGSPCEKELTKKYLKVLHTCIPRRVFGEYYQGKKESDEPSFGEEYYYYEYDLHGWDAQKGEDEIKRGESKSSHLGSGHAGHARGHKDGNKWPLPSSNILPSRHDPAAKGSMSDGLSLNPLLISLGIIGTSFIVIVLLVIFVFLPKILRALKTPVASSDGTGRPASSTSHPNSPQSDPEGDTKTLKSSRGSTSTRVYQDLNESDNDGIEGISVANPAATTISQGLSSCSANMVVIGPCATNQLPSTIIKSGPSKTAPSQELLPILGANDCCQGLYHSKSDLVASHCQTNPLDPSEMLVQSTFVTRAPTPPMFQKGSSSSNMYTCNYC